MTLTIKVLHNGCVGLHCRSDDTDVSHWTFNSNEVNCPACLSVMGRYHEFQLKHDEWADGLGVGTEPQWAFPPGEIRVSQERKDTV